MRARAAAWGRPTSTSTAPMRSLVLARTAVSAPMGAQAYERQIVAGAAAALASDPAETWRVVDFPVRSLRSPLAGAGRAPIGLLERAGRGVRATVGRVLYPRDALVHRMDLTLPPSPGEVVSVHDLALLRYPDEGRSVRSAGAELRDSAAVLICSQASADEIRDLWGLENTHVVPLGVEDRFRDATPLTSARRAELGLTGRYVLHAGGVTRRKNLPALAEAWRRVSAAVPDVVLALAGPPHPRRTELFRGLDRVVLLGRLPSGDMPGLMAAADAVVIPSLYEGFGLPVLEAMAAGTPVVAAATSSIPEVAGDAAVLVEPTGPALGDALVDVLRGVVDRDGLVARGRLRASAYTWERCLAETAAVWRSAAG